MNKQGRRYDREKWGWKDESQITPDNDELIAALEEYLDDKPTNEDQGKTQRMRNNTTKILAWTIIAGISIFVAWGVVIAIKSVI